MIFMYKGILKMGDWREDNRKFKYCSYERDQIWFIRSKGNCVDSLSILAKFSLVHRWERLFSNYIRTNCVNTANILERKEDFTWPKLKEIIGHVYQHTCGNAYFHDMKTLLYRKGLWNDNYLVYLTQVVNSWENFQVIKAPLVNRPLSPSRILQILMMYFKLII